jgi:DNA polymerase III subunit delta'
MSALLTRGHPAAAAAIAAMIVGPVPHALLIAGSAGVGKTTLAADLAAGLLCDAADPAARPCRVCRGCRLVDSGGHADLHRLVPGGAGDQIRIGDRAEPEPGTIRRLISELALLPVEGGARVAIVERAERLNEEAQSALLKTLEEPPAGVTIILCVEREDQLLPTVRSRCVRLRLGPVGTRDIEAILGGQGVADATTASQLAKLASGRPGLARAWALAPEAVAARAEIVRSILDLLTAPTARRLAAIRELIARAADVERALAKRNVTGASAETTTKGGRSRRGRAASGAARGPSSVAMANSDGGGASAAVAASPTGEVDAAGDAGDGAGGGMPGSADDGDTDEPRDTRAPASERRRAATTLVAIWRDVARDLAVAGLGDERLIRDAGLLDELRAAAGIPTGELAAFLERLDRSGELIEANASPELVLDVLVLSWPRRWRAA